MSSFEIIRPAQIHIPTRWVGRAILLTIEYFICSRKYDLYEIFQLIVLTGSSIAETVTNPVLSRIFL